MHAKGDVAAYLELHIEQGGTLDAAGIAIGMVEGIVGIRQWDVTVTGFANHAGTTPMDERQDALLAAARFVDMVNRVATEPTRPASRHGRPHSGLARGGELAGELPVSRPAVSQHLRVLKEAGLVTERREGTRRIYRLDPEGLGEVRAYFDRFWTVALESFEAAVARNGEEQR